MLIVQSVTGRAVAVLTVLAVVAVSGGLISFLAGLAYDGGRLSSADVARPITVDEEDTGDADAEEIVSDSGSGRVNAPSAPVADREVVARESTESHPESAPASVATFRVVADLADRLAACPACGRAFQAGQIAAQCRVCGNAHHASCWIDTDFHCAVPGCPGGGSLESPGPVPSALMRSANAASPRGGPSKP